MVGDRDTTQIVIGSHLRSPPPKSLPVAWDTICRSVRLVTFPSTGKSNSIPAFSFCALMPIHLLVVITRARSRSLQYIDQDVHANEL